MYLTLLNKLLAAEEDPTLSDADKNSLLILIVSLKRLIDNRRCLEISQNQLNRPTSIMFSDAMRDTTRIGAGSLVYHHDKKAEFGQFFSYDKKLIKEFNIAHLEALTPLLHIAGATHLRDLNMIIFVDNAGAVISLAKQCSNDPALAAIVNLTWQTLADRNLSVWFAYINTKRNPADEASRLDEFSKFLVANSSYDFVRITYPVDIILEKQRQLKSQLSELSIKQWHPVSTSQKGDPSKPLSQKSSQ